MTRVRISKPTPRGKLTVKELSARWGEPSQKIRRWIRSGWLKAERDNDGSGCESSASRWLVTKAAAAACEKSFPHLLLGREAS